MNNKKERKLFNTKEAADMLGISVSMLAKDRMNKGEIPYIKIGKKAIRYDYHELKRYLRRKRRGS